MIKIDKTFINLITSVVFYKKLDIKNILLKDKSFYMVKKGFLLAAFIYFFNSIGNVGQGVFIKYFQHKLSIDLYQLMTMARIIEIAIVFPFVLKYLRHFTKNIGVVLLLSGLYSIDMLLFHRGLKTVAINTGVLIMLLVPVWIVFFGRVILKEKQFNKYNAIALLSCLMGVFITIYSEVKFDGFNSGYLFLFADSIAIPLGLILQKKYSEYRPVMYAVFTNAIMLSIFGYFLSGCKIAPFSVENVKGATVIALFDILEVSCVYIAYKMTDCALLQPIRFTRIIISMLLSAFILKEMPTQYQLIGAVIILVANVVSIIYSKKQTKGN